MLLYSFDFARQIFATLGPLLYLIRESYCHACRSIFCRTPKIKTFHSVHLLSEVGLACGSSALPSV